MVICSFIVTGFLLQGCQTSCKEVKMNFKESGEHLECIFDYYTAYGIMTDPGEHVSLYQDLPSEIPKLCKVVQGVMIHVFHAHRHGVRLSDERRKEVQIRRVEDMLARIKELDERPVIFERDADRRVVGNCRDFSLLLCSLLRHEGIPARARCGFSRYFTRGRYEDHWICEFWNAEEDRWVQVDAQLDDLQREAFAIEFDPYDVPRNEFLPAGEVWRLCRTEKLNPDLCGIMDLKGLWFVRGNVVRDFMALNNLELLPWDCNELMDISDDKLTQDDYTLLDRVAELTTKGNRSFLETRSLFESNAAVRMPDEWEP